MRRGDGAEHPHLARPSVQRRDVADRHPDLLGGLQRPALAGVVRARESAVGAEQPPLRIVAGNHRGQCTIGAAGQRDRRPRGTSIRRAVRAAVRDREHGRSGDRHGIDRAGVQRRSNPRPGRRCRRQSPQPVITSRIGRVVGGARDVPDGASAASEQAPGVARIDRDHGTGRRRADHLIRGGAAGHLEEREVDGGRLCPGRTVVVRPQDAPGGVDHHAPRRRGIPRGAAVAAAGGDIQLRERGAAVHRPGQLDAVVGEQHLAIRWIDGEHRRARRQRRQAVPRHAAGVGDVTPLCAPRDHRAAGGGNREHIQRADVRPHRRPHVSRRTARRREHAQPEAREQHHHEMAVPPSQPPLNRPHVPAQVYAKRAPAHTDCRPFNRHRAPREPPAPLATHL